MQNKTKLIVISVVKSYTTNKYLRKNKQLLCFDLYLVVFSEIFHFSSPDISMEIC